MSYILDALRRADAERRQGQAPDLQQVTALPADATVGASTGGRHGSRWLALGLVLLVGVGLAGWWFGRGSAPTLAGVPSPPTAVVPSPPPAAAPLAPAMAPAPTPAPTIAAARIAPPPASRPVPAAVPAPSPVPPAEPPPARAAAPVPAAVPPAGPSPRPADPAPRPPAPVAAPAPARPIPASALPEPQRSAVAALSIGGAVHSQDRSQSFVLVGGQLVHEGAALAPGIVLERIQPGALWLRVDGQLVELPL